MALRTSIRNPLIALIILDLAFLAMLADFATELPGRMATHFDVHGEPNGWMQGSSYLAFMAVFGLLFPLVVPAICWSARFLPTGMINVPNRQYWLSTERRGQTDGYLFGHALWFSVLQIALVIVLHGLVVEANHHVPVRLSNAIWAALAVFLAGVVAWIIGMVLHFGRTEISSEQVT